MGETGMRQEIIGRLRIVGKWKGIEGHGEGMDEKVGE